MKIYKSCNTLPIGRFFRVFETQDYRHLVRGYDYENDNLKLTPEKELELSVIFKDIFYEYSELTQNHKLRSHLKKQGLIEQWEFLYKLVTNCLYIYMEYGDLEVLDLINKVEEPGYEIDIEESIKPQIDKIVSKTKGLKNKIKIFKIKFAKSVKNDNSDDKPKYNLERNALYLERNLELRSQIDPETTSVARWVTLVEMNKEKSKEYAKSKGRNKTGS